jgi:plastocyanin
MIRASSMRHRLHHAALLLGAAVAAVGGAVGAAVPLDAAGGTYTAPFQAGPSGGDQYNVVREMPAQGRVAVLRAYPFPGAFNCAGQGGFADLRLTTVVPTATSSVALHYGAETAVDAYSWITLLVRDSGGSWLGGVQRRGPLAGPGVLSTGLASTVPAGSLITVQFGMQVASACPNVDGGTVQFSSVVLNGTAAAAPVHVGLPPAARAQSTVAASSTAAPAVRVHGAATLTAIAFTFVPGDDDTSRAPLRVIEGSTLLFTNLDALAPHTVNSVATSADGAPLFSSGAPTSAGQTSPVVGVAALPPGQYTFYCRVHTQMQGVLRVLSVAAAHGRWAFVSW